MSPHDERLRLLRQKTRVRDSETVVRVPESLEAYRYVPCMTTHDARRRGIVLVLRGRKSLGRARKRKSDTSERH